MLEGIPSDTPPKRILRMLECKRSMELDEQRALALTLTHMLSVFQSGGSFMDIASHLYTEDARKGIAQAQEEHKAEQSSLNMLERLRAVANHWDDQK